MSDIICNVKTIIGKLKEILKCDICHNLFDFNEHIPLITKTGETFCKQCLSDDKINLKVQNKLKVNIHDDNLFINKFVENLKLKIIIKEILNIYDNNITPEKPIIISTNSNERNNSNNQRYGHYLLTYSNNSNGLKENISKEKVYNNSKKKIKNKKNYWLNNSKSGINKNINFNNSSNIKNENTMKSINNISSIKNNDEKEKKENHNKINSQTQESGLKSPVNNNQKTKKLKINNLNIFDIDDNLNTFVLNDEMKINMNKEKNKFEEKENNDIKEINDDSIETIPINEERSTLNISFKNEFYDFFLKNDELQGESINQKELKNDLSKYIFINKNNLIYKNNQKIACSTVNIKKNTSINSKEKKKDEKNNKFYHLSEPNLDNINMNNSKINDKLDTEENIKINKKEEEKSLTLKTEENKLKRIYKNSKYYDYEKKQITEFEEKFENKNQTSMSNNKYKNYNKINNRFQPGAQRQILSKEIKRKIEEDEAEGSKIYKNLTSIKRNTNNFNEKNKIILFDEGDGRTNNKFKINSDLEYKEKLYFSNNIHKKSKCYINNQTIKHNITYNKKILGKSSLSPKKNNSQDFPVKKNKSEYFKKLKYYKNNNLKYRTISQSQANENLINTDNNNNNKNNISTNIIMKSSTTKNNIPISIINNSYKKNNNTNNIRSIPKINSIYLKINSSKKYINNKNKDSENIQNSNIFNNSGNEISDLEEIIKNEDEIKYLTDEKIISNKKAKTFMYKTKDELDNLYSGNRLNSNKRGNKNQNLLINNYLEKKIKEFNIIYNERIKNEQNLDIKNYLLKNKSKYFQIVKNSINCPLFNNSLNEVQILFLQNGDFYLGILSPENNSPQKGILYSMEGNCYEGRFINGKKDGKGIIIYKNGAKYEGEIKNNLHNGFGKLTQLDGEVFIGQWKEGKICGKGVRYHRNGDVYCGFYVNSIRDGLGKYVFSNGDSYEGQWKNGKANGKGFFKFKNGDIYEGNFQDNNFCGQGCLRKKTGDIYIGEFKDGDLNGEGTSINKDKEKYIGNFVAGKKEGKGVLYDKNGNIIKTGIWKSDEFVSE